MLNLRSLDQADLSPGVRVFLASDFDVPIDSRGGVADTFRLQALLPTINYLQESGAVVIMGGHLGRPGGRIDPRFSLVPVKVVLEKLLSKDLVMLENPLSPVVPAVLDRASPGSLFMLENLRFSPLERASDTDFAKKLSFLAQVYVNENFSTSHHDDASLIQIPQILPGFAGFRLIAEVEHILSFREEAPHPVVAVIGGAKLEDKGAAVRDLAAWVDTVLVGGKVGFDLTESDVSDNVVLPLDGVDGKDIGPKTIAKYSEVLDQAQSVLWSGPLGVVENKNYQKGTKILADRVVGGDNLVLIGGGETLEVFRRFKLRDKIDWASVGGGAMLALLASKKLPALEALAV